MHKLPIHCNNGRWEVQIPVGDGAMWIQCDSHQDAHKMSVSGKLAFDAIERHRVGVELSEELKDAALLFFKYNCSERAIWLVEHAKFAVGEPSIFDESHSGEE